MPRRLWICAVFLLSGFAALLYQIVWQRALYAIYGINIESVTMIVTAFMLGLGIGSLVGGIVSKDALKKPVTGSLEQGFNGPPRTLREGRGVMRQNCAAGPRGATPGWHFVPGEAQHSVRSPPHETTRQTRRD